MCKKRDCWLTRYTKKEYNKVREGFKRYIHQYLADNDIDNNFNKNIVLTTTSGNFFYDDYGIKYFMTLNGLIPIKMAKNIVMSINNNAFAYSLTGSIEPSTEPSTARRSNDGNRSSNNKDKSTTYFYNNNPPNLTIDIDLLDCHFNDNG